MSTHKERKRDVIVNWPRKYSRKAKIVAELERIEISIAEAIKERDFDPRSKAWQSYAETIALSTDIAGCGSVVEETMTRDRYVEMVESWFKMNPNIQLTCKSQAIKVDMKSNTATASSVTTYTGTPEKTMTESVDFLEFSLVNEEWKITGVSSMRGVDLFRLDGIQ